MLLKSEAKYSSATANNKPFLKHKAIHNRKPVLVRRSCDFSIKVAKILNANPLLHTENISMSRLNGNNKLNIVFFQMST